MYRRFAEPDTEFRQIYNNTPQRRQNSGIGTPFPMTLDSLKSLLPEGTDIGDVILLLVLLLLYIDTNDEEFLITLLGTFFSSK